MALNFPPLPLTVGQQYTFNSITWFWNGSAWELLTATDAVFNRLLIGSNANFTDFPNARFISSQSDSGHSHSYNFGIVGEAVASSSDTNLWGVGVYGKGNANVGTRGAGLLGDGGVTNTTDTASAVGVRAYATEAHTGGDNVALYAAAQNSSTNNYALYMSDGNIYSGTGQTWTLADNNATALNFLGGATSILKLVSTTGSKGVTMGGTLGVTGATTLSSTLGVTVTTDSNAVTVTYNPTTTSGAAIVTTGKDTQGGTGYFDFLKVTNTTSGATNPNKSFRVTSTGTIEIINSAYGATIFALSDAGRVTVEGVTSTGATGTGKFVFDTIPTISDPSFTGTVSLAPATFESVNSSATAATGTVNIDVKTNTVFYYTANAIANWTFNFRGNGTTTLDTYLSTGKSITVVFLVTQGVTAFYPTAFTADGSAVTPKWLSGTAPSGGNASSIDSYSFTIIKTAAATYTILASQARFA